jgi:signal peptide peptidase SppA
MPLPTPTKKEKNDKPAFIDRCMGNSTMNRDFPDAKQRRAVCESQWDKKDKASSYSSIANYLCTSQWAILPEMLDTIHDIVSVRINDGKLSLKEIEARISKDDESESGAYTSGGVRVIPVHGTISKRMNLFSRVSGGVSTEQLKDEIEEALSDDGIKSILLDIESPGGSVDGIFELSDFIYESRGKKPITAFANGLMASAAYLIGSATDKIIGTQAAQVGSIGVITKHFDYSERNKQEGVTETIITAGKYKAIGSDNKPLSVEDKKYIQDRLDYFYTLFVDSVARNRDVSAETVLSDMADGRIFIGKQAQWAGLIDEIGTIDTILSNQDFVGGVIEMNAEMSYSHNSKLKEGEPVWSTYISAHRKELPDSAFADTANRKYPHHWISGGVMYLHRGGLAAARSRAGQYDPGSGVTAHLNVHAKAIGMGEKTKGGERTMTLKELKADKDLYDALTAEVKAETEAADAGLEKRVHDLESKLSDRDTELADRDNRISALEKENEKREAMKIETEKMATAKGIVMSKLSESQVPERLYGKVVGLVNYSQFMKDEKTEDFEAIVDAEVKEWEALGLNTAIDGLGTNTKDEANTNTEEKADEDRADRLFSIVK